ncbi:vegetative cell wall protein gp1-like [Ananas comosus]|uniref:Vegetative cell wall protein gp1-like n=1 Tax=Ananas comosus TaxID=4615 RepID=A0A6P5GEP6_ANACO|nr:vegetative cell wall protein gp1-like [Ananas comosus]
MSVFELEDYLHLCESALAALSRRPARPSSRACRKRLQPGRVWPRPPSQARLRFGGLGTALPCGPKPPVAPRWRSPCNPARCVPAGPAMLRSASRLQPRLPPPLRSCRADLEPAPLPRRRHYPPEVAPPPPPSPPPDIAPADLPRSPPSLPQAPTREEVTARSPPPRHGCCRRRRHLLPDLPRPAAPIPAASARRPIAAAILAPQLRELVTFGPALAVLRSRSLSVIPIDSLAPRR